MSRITDEQYRHALARIEELLPLVNDETATDDPNGIELDIMSNLVVEYETEHFPIGNLKTRIESARREHAAGTTLRFSDKEKLNEWLEQL